MSQETAILPDLIAMPAKARAALLLSALEILQSTVAIDLVTDTRRRFPAIARPQLMQQALLDLMAYVRAGAASAPHALLPTAGRAYVGLSCHLGEEPTRLIGPFAIELWGLIESLFPDHPGTMDPERAERDG
jgi:hypothetical protein